MLRKFLTLYNFKCTSRCVLASNVILFENVKIGVWWLDLLEKQTNKNKRFKWFLNDFILSKHRGFADFPSMWDVNFSELSMVDSNNMTYSLPCFSPWLTSSLKYVVLCGKHLKNKAVSSAFSRVFQYLKSVLENSLLRYLIQFLKITLWPVLLGSKFKFLDSNRS